MPMTDDELRALPWTRDLMTREELKNWVATRKAAGRAIDIATCELGRWHAYDPDPYGVRELLGELHPEERSIGTNRFVRSPESRGWVHEGDLPCDKGRGMYDRIYREAALFEAATERHPGWHRLGVNASRIDDNAPDYPELLEWFRRSFPGEARAIEAHVDEDRLRRQRQRRQ
jgi:hypothetical protein